MQVEEPLRGRNCLDGFRRTDHAQILGCLTDGITWTVFGAFYPEGKAAYAAAIEGPGFAGDPDLEVVRMVAEGDTIMASLSGRVPQQDGSVQRLSMAEVFSLRDGLIHERRARVVPLHQDGIRRALGGQGRAAVCQPGTRARGGHDVTADTHARTALAVALAGRPDPAAAPSALPAAQPDRPDGAAADPQPRPAVTRTRSSQDRQDPRCELDHRGSWCSDTPEA